MMVKVNRCTDAGQGNTDVEASPVQFRLTTSEQNTQLCKLTLQVSNGLVKVCMTGTLFAMCLEMLWLTLRQESPCFLIHQH